MVYFRFLYSKNYHRMQSSEIFVGMLEFSQSNFTMTFPCHVIDSPANETSDNFGTQHRTNDRTPKTTKTNTMLINNVMTFT